MCYLGCFKILSLSIFKTSGVLKKWNLGYKLGTQFFSVMTSYKCGSRPLKLRFQNFWPISKTKHRKVTKLVSKDAEDTISSNPSRELEGVPAVEKMLFQKNYFFSLKLENFQ